MKVLLKNNAERTPRDISRIIIFNGEVEESVKGSKVS